MIDEWSAAAPGRFIPLIIIPLWDPQLAAREIERCAGLGAKAIAFSENPSKLGLPSLHDVGNYWDPILSAANDTKMPLCAHFGSSSSMPKTSDDAPLFVVGSLAPVNLLFALVDWVFSGKLIDGDRSPYPDLKICFSEGGIGWIPYILERCDLQVEKRPYLEEKDWKVEAGSGLIGEITEGGRRMGVPPSEVFRRHMYGCFIDDDFGARHLEEVGIDNVMLETDFPHGDSSFPNSLANAHKRLARYDFDVQQKVMQGNACRVFQFEPATIPQIV
jgi:predicted TIM-barrel fold metal-dependent hydrolase